MKILKRGVRVTAIEVDQFLERVAHVGCTPGRSVSNVDCEKDGDEDDRADNADNAISADACAEKSYFESLGLGHESYLHLLQLDYRVELVHWRDLCGHRQPRLLVKRKLLFCQTDSCTAGGAALMAKNR